MGLAFQLYADDNSGSKNTVTAQSVNQLDDALARNKSGEIILKLPSEKAPKGIELEAEWSALQEEKDQLDVEFKEIIAERDRLAIEKGIDGNIYDNQEYNEAIFRLNNRIDQYQLRCDSYEAKVQAINNKIKALRWAFSYEKQVSYK